MGIKEFFVSQIRLGEETEMNGRCRMARWKVLVTAESRFVCLIFCLAFAVQWVFPTTAKSAEERPKRPNIVLIMSDDMGYSDIGCYGGEIETPNLDRLAAGGLRYTQFYNTARCCPTRASLLTGLYPHQTGIGHMVNDRGVDGYRGDLNRECMTIAELLKTSGYATYMSGKWHVTKHVRPQGPKFNWPLERGFDRYYGTIRGAGSFWDPSTLVRDNTMITPVSDEQYRPTEPYYYTDAISDQGARFIREHQGEEPFFLYVAYTAAHWPMHARERDIAKYRGRYDAGYRAVRAKRFEQMQKLGVIGSNAKLSAPAGDWANVENKRWEAACMEVYAAMVDSMDQGIGRLTKALSDTGQLENTLIFYLQDNGGCAETQGRKGKGNARQAKPTREPIAADAQHYFVSRPEQTRDGFPVRQGVGVIPGPADTYIGYGKSWANVSNTPFREYKHWVHEGGISTPLIAHWPAGFAARNELRHQPGHLIDIMATCADVAGARYPREHKGTAIIPLEGQSLVESFSNENVLSRTLFWEHEGNRAVRVGDWKLVAKGRSGPWELYDLQADRSELNNLASREPDRVAELTALWQQYAHRARVIPWPARRR